MSATTGGYAQDDLVTGEAVSLDLPVAGVGVRMVSGTIDVALAIAALVAGSITAGVITSGASLAVARVAVILVTALALVGVPVTLETVTRGRSLGKMALGLRTVRDDGGPITVRHALVRGLVGFVEIYLFFGAPALVSALVNQRSKRLGDIAAGTYVLSERSALLLVPGPAMPPGLAGWAAAADIAPLPDGLAVAARQLLARAATLSVVSRAHLAHDVRHRLMAHVAPQPDPSWPDEAVIAAVLAERRRRDAERIVRDDALVARVLPPDPLGR